MSIKDKINAIATKVYGADGVDYSPAANKAIAEFEKNGWGNLPICMSKTLHSLHLNQRQLHILL